MAPSEEAGRQAEHTLFRNCREELSQQWLDHRFAGLSSSDFEQDVRIFCTASLKAPSGFEPIWAQFTSSWPEDQPLLTDEESAAAHSILIFVDVGRIEQLELLRSLVLAVDNLGHDAPPILWVPHTVHPDMRPSDGSEKQLAPSEVVRELLELGVDGIMPGEPVGYRLSIAFRAFIHKSSCFTKSMSDLVNERRSRAQYAEYLTDCTQCIVWDYLRIRLAPSIPAVDYDIPAGELTDLDGFTFGQMLGRGAFGTVYSLTAPNGTEGEVMKVVNKSVMLDVQDLRSMKRMIDVMRLLSTDEWRHPNVVQLYYVYHSTTHMFFRMEYGGPINLYRRLSLRQKEGDRRRLLSKAEARAIIQQATTAVTHLHTGPRVCHRDVKPENLIIMEEAEVRLDPELGGTTFDEMRNRLSERARAAGTEEITPEQLSAHWASLPSKAGPGAVLGLKLTDFDLAVVQETDATMCRAPCGTMPFAAPEVLLEREYNGMAADVWSLGIVFLEVLCGVRIVERVLELNADGGLAANGAAPEVAPSGNAARAQGANGWPSKDAVRRIRAGFATEGASRAMLSDHCLPELRPLLDVSQTMLDGMLRVDVAERWRVPCVLEAAHQLPDCPTPEC